MPRDWLRQLWRQLFGAKNCARPVRRKLRSIRLGVEILEDRLAPASNIAITNAAVVDANDNPLTVVNVGTWVYIQADFTTQSLPSNASYRVAITVNGLTLDSSYVTWGAGNSGTGSWNLYWGTFLATPGTNQVTATVDPDHSVAETTYADNTTSFSFNAVSPQMSGSSMSYTVAQIRAAYGISNIPNFGSAPADGSGQTIALDEAGNDPNIITDLDGFDEAMSLTTGPTPTLYQEYGPASSFVTVYNQSGTNITANIATSGSDGVPAEDPTGHWEGEETLDVEWAHAIAPGAKIDIIEVPDDGNWPTNLLAGDVLAASLPGVSVVSNSYGLSEWSGETAYDSSTFVTPSGHTGVTFLTASNDNGANVYGVYGPSVGSDGYYPATSPNVVSVGGTELTLNSNAYGSETGWSFPTPTSTIDNGSSSYTQTGSWASQSGGFSGAYSTAAGGSSSSAAWTVPITTTNTGWGTEVSATWTANSSNATNATYTVYDGTQASGTILGTITIDQTKAPAGTAEGSAQFQELGVFFPTLTASGTGTLTVVLNANSANGTVDAEAIGSAPAWASTGGPTPFESAPSYQLPFQSTGYRTTPDVSFDASENSGVDTYYTQFNNPANSGLDYGSFGTSLSSPCWAGLIAIANQGRVAYGGTTLNSTANPMQTVQALYSLPAGDFHDITSGYNGFSAGAGYDEVTGRGSPIANLLIPDLVSYPASLSQSTVSVAPTSIQSGSTATVTLTARDANGNQLTSGGLTVTFGLGSGGSSGTFSSVTDNGDGTYTATFTGTTAGTPCTITATIDGSTVISTLPTITVTPGAVSLSESTVSVAPTSIQSGSTATVTLTAEDANGNQETSGDLTVLFGLGSGGSSGTFSSVTDNGDGTYTATFTGTTAGTPCTITATIDGSAVTSALPTITVTPGAVSLFESTVSVAPPSIQSGNKATVTLTANDANGNQETSGGLTVVFALGTGSSAGTFSGVSYIGNGTYTATFTGTTAGTARTITASIGGSAVTSSLPTITVNQPALFTSANNAAFAVGSLGSFTIMANGFPVPTLSESNTDTLPSGVTFTAATGVLAGTPAARSAGTYTLHFTADNGIGSAATQAFTLTINQPAAFTSTNNTTFTVGNAGSFTVVASGIPAPTLSESTTDTLPRGVTFTPATGVLAGTPAAGAGGTYTLHFTAHNGIGSDATQTFTLTVNQPAAFSSAAGVAFAVGSSGNFTVAASGFPGPTLSESSTDTLPSGVTFNPTTGILTGTPAAGTGGTYPLQFTAHNGIGSDAGQAFTLTVNQPSAFTNTNSTAFTVGNAGSFTVVVSGFPTPILSETNTDTLPTGVTFTPATGTLQGTPAAASAGTYTLHFTAHNGIGSDATQTFTLTINQPAAFTSANTAAFAVGSAGSFTVAASGFPTPTLSESGSDTLPDGVAFDPTTGILAGTPTAGSAGTYTLHFTAHNGIDADATQTFTLTVANTVPPTFSSANATTFAVATAGSFMVTASGAPAPTLSESNTDTLPSGVTFTPATGILAGTPAAGTAGTYTLHFTAHNAVGADATQTFTLTVGQPAAFTSAGGVAFAVGLAGTFTVTASGFPAPTLSESNTDTLPGGVTFTPATGVLAGTPAAGSGGTYTLHFTAHNGVGADATQTVTLTVNQPAAFTSANNSAFTVGAAGSFTVAASGLPAPALSESNTDTLPSGVTFTPATGVLSGTPAAGTGGTYTLHFTAHNDIGSDATQSFTLTVNQPAAFTNADNTTFAVGSPGTFTVTASGTPVPVLSESGSDTLPSGVTFTPATGVLAGTPAAGSGGTYTLHFTAHNGIGADATQTFTLTVTTTQPPVFTSADNTSFSVGTAGSFSVTASGRPAPTLSESNTDTLPSGVTFTAATGIFAGTPAAGTGGTYTLHFTAHNGVDADATQTFTLTVDQPASFISANNASFTEGTSGSFTVAAGGTPTPAVSEQAGDTLPSGVTFTPATGLLSGTPAAGTAGSYTLHFTAHNGIGADATQTFTLTVNPANFSYDAATMTLTITANAAINNFTFGQATTEDASGTLHTIYNFTLNGVTQSYTNSQVVAVFVDGVATGNNTAILITNSTYVDNNGVTQGTKETISLGSKTNAGAGTMVKYDASGNPFTFLTLSNFPISYAYVGRNDGTVSLYGTVGVAYNGFVSAGNYSYIGGLGLYHEAQGATSVYGYSAGQPTDFAYQYSANPGSSFVVSGTAFSYMSCADQNPNANSATQSFFNVGVGFNINTGVSRNPGQDYAYIIDSPGNDTFVGGNAYSYMYIQNAGGTFAELDSAYAFALVYAESFVGGTDTAINGDPNKNILGGNWNVQ